MSTALVVGLGVVGVRAARQLVDTPGIERVLLADRNRGRARQLVEAFGAERADTVAFSPGDVLPEGVDVVATALPTGDDRPVVEQAIAQRVACASVDDDHDAIERLRLLHDRAETAGVTVAIGCGLAPGIADLLAKHAASTFDAIDEIRVARTGWAGEACAAAVRAARRGTAVEWAEGAWRRDQYHDDQLVWFPDPIGARDCRIVSGGVALLVDAFPDAARISTLLGEPPARRRWRRQFDEAGEWGAARVEVWGQRGTSRDVMVYGVIERTSVAAGTMLAVAAAHLVGALGTRVERPGVAGPAVLFEPVPLLGELAERGVRAAAFEGVPVG
ncbi:MAG TPA: saccharopine dehydrogenase NADP-binding domain-containing protein [Acidimicrobiia bacterium]|nr:saccharopine dehydrogenase NADP-binding domain-containing protein [Acidimicrobiia bacterium]